MSKNPTSVGTSTRNAIGIMIRAGLSVQSVKHWLATEPFCDSGQSIVLMDDVQSFIQSQGFTMGVDVAQHPSWNSPECTPSNAAAAEGVQS